MLCYLPLSHLCYFAAPWRDVDEAELKQVRFDDRADLVLSGRNELGKVGAMLAGTHAEFISP